MGARNILRLFSEGIKGDRASVTQTTNRTTAVVINAMSGTITTDDASLAAGARATFTVTNGKVASGDVVAINHAGAQPADGTVKISVSDIADGSFKINVDNPHASSATTAVYVLNFVVLGGSPA